MELDGQKDSSSDGAPQLPPDQDPFEVFTSKKKSKRRRNKKQESSEESNSQMAFGMGMPPFPGVNPQFYQPYMPQPLVNQANQFPNNYAIPMQGSSSSRIAQLVERQNRQTNMRMEQLMVEVSTIKTMMLSNMGTMGTTSQQQLQAPTFNSGYGTGYPYHPMGYPSYPFSPVGVPQGYSPFTAMQPRQRSSKKKKKNSKNTKPSNASCKPAEDSLPSSSTEDSENEIFQPHSSKMSRRAPWTTNNNNCDNQKQKPSTFTNPNAEPKDENEVPGTSKAVDRTHESVSTMDINDEFTKPTPYQEAAKFYQAGKVNLVWQKVTEAEHLKETETKMDAVTLIDKFVVPRGPESYVVGNKRKRKLPEEIRKEADDEAKETEDQYATDSSISSGGLSERSKKCIKEYSAKKRASAKPHENHKDKLTGQQLLLEKFAEMDDKALPNFIAKKLYEDKTKWHLFVRTFKVFGREFMIKLFLKTLKIERLGGIFTKSEKRRRTPGGVFLHLLRHDNRLSQADRDAVFEYDKEKAREEQRQDKAYQKRKMFESMFSKLQGNGEVNELGDQTGSQVMEFDLGEDERHDEEHSYQVTESNETGTVLIPLGDFRLDRQLIDYSDIVGGPFM